MAIHDLAGLPAPQELLINVPRLVSAYYVTKPVPTDPDCRIAFGTSGHRGTALKGSFNEDHILAISQAVCEYRACAGIDGPLFLGMDTHALIEPALATAVEVFAANKVNVFIQKGLGYTPTPVISHAILSWNKDRKTGFADGVVLTPSHNPPEDGGYKYNPPEGGPAGATVTAAIQKRANEILGEGRQSVRRMSYARALQSDVVHQYDYIKPYIQDLRHVIDMQIIKDSGLKIGVDPMGGSGLAYWEPMATVYGLDLTVTNTVIDPTFSFMTVDKDGKIRMDCSSPAAMASLIRHKDSYDIAFGNDPDYDRHGIVTRSAGLLNPNHYLAVAIEYLFTHRPQWNSRAAVGKTLVSSSMIDRVARALKREVYEVPVGFKWFVESLLNGSCTFGGEESAGASFSRFDGTAWTTDKDGIILNLLAAEMTARLERDPGELYASLEARFGSPVYERIQAPASREQKAAFASLTAAKVETETLAGERIISKQVCASGNNAPFGGLKVTTENGWFAARPSGTEEVYKIYAESFIGEGHLHKIQTEAQDIVNQLFS